MVVLDVSPNNATVTLRWDVIDSTSEQTRESARCFVSVDTGPTQPNNPNSGNPDGDSPALGRYRADPLTVAVSVILPVLFVMIVLLGVFMLVMYKKVKQVTGYFSTPYVDEKKPLIQK